MPDPDLIPRGRAFPAAEAPNLDAVLTGARRRRRVRAGVVGAVAGSGALVAVLLALPGASTSSLKTVTPAVGQTPPAGQHHAPAGGQPSKPPVIASAPAGTRTAGPTGNAGVRAASTAPTSKPATTSQRPIVGPPHRTTSYDASKSCNGTGPTPATGWCSYYNGATAGRAGHSVVLATDVCRLPGQAAAVLTSDDGQQADFSAFANRAYPSQWTWSHGRKFASAGTSITVAPGSCVEWFVSWRVVDDKGRPLAAGTYGLAATPLSSPKGNASASVQNNAYFTVTG